MSLLRDLQQLREKLLLQRAAVDERLDAVARVIARIEELQKADPALAASSNMPILVKHDGMIVLAQLHDMAEYHLADKSGLDFKIEDLAHEKDFVAGLAAGCARNNLQAIWTDALTHMVTATSTDLVEGDVVPCLHDESLDIAEGRHEKYGVTTLSFAFQATNKAQLQTTETHIVINKETRQAVVVGESKLAHEMKAAIEAAGVTYISRHEAQAAAKIDKAIDALLAHDEKRSLMKDRLYSAAFYRIEESQQAMRKKYTRASLGDVLAGKRGTSYAKYVVKPRG